MRARSLRGRNTRSEKAARRGQFSVLLRRIVGTTQRKRTEKWTAVALLQSGYFLPRRLLVYLKSHDFSSCPWMMLFIQLTQTPVCDMRVYLGRRDITVSEQHLYDPQISTMVQ